MCKQIPKFQEPEVIKVHLGHPQGWSWSWRRPLEVVCRPLDVRHHRRPAVEDSELLVGGGGIEIKNYRIALYRVLKNGGYFLLVRGGGHPLVHERGDALSRV